jgi:DNA-binding SARP family transcriptional activator
MQGDVRFAVLGPVRAWRGEAELELGQPKQRAVLAALLVREGAQVTLEQLIDDVWGDDAPATSAKAIRSYIYQLRLVLGRDGTGHIRSVGGGYVLDAGPQLDLARFADLVARARQARRDGDPATAAARFAEGLGLWAGTALAGIPGPCAAGQRTRLGELRLSVQEEHLATAVDLGHYDQAATELSALVAGHPLRERLRELQMHALYGAGRQAEALAAFRRAARMLSDELGIDPGPGLRTMHQRILSTDPALLRPAPVPPPAAPSATPSPTVTPVTRATPPPVTTASPPAPVPAQLPADIAHFTGRDAQLDALTALAAEPEAVEVLIGLCARLPLALNITAPAAASLTAANREQATAALDELAAAHLIAEHAPGRYSFHDLLRAYAADQASTRNILAATLELQGRNREALGHAQQALELYRAAGHQAGQANALNTIGWFHSLLGDHQQALAHCQQALALHRRLGYPLGQAGTYDSLGRAYQHLGDHRQALECYRHALDLYRTIRHPQGEAISLDRLGDTHHAAGDRDAARDAWEQAQAIFEDLQHPDAEQVRQKLKAAG